MNDDLDRHLESDLDKALKDDMANEGLLAPSTPRGKTTVAGPGPAMEHLRTAIEGLVKLEAEWVQLAHDLVGELKLDEHDVPTPSDKGALIPRLRADAELLARLALRQHKLIQEVRALL